MFETIQCLYHKDILAFLKRFSSDRITDISIEFHDTGGHRGIENPAGYSVSVSNYKVTNLTLATLESDFADSNIQVLRCDVQYGSEYSDRITIDCLKRELVVYNDETLVPISVLRAEKMIGRYELFRRVEYKFT